MTLIWVPGDAHKNGVLFNGTDRGIIVGGASANTINGAGDFLKLYFQFLLPDISARTEPIPLFDLSNNAGGYMAAIVANSSTASGALGRGLCLGVGNASRRYFFSARYTWVTGTRYYVEFTINFRETGVIDHEIWVNGVPQTIFATEVDDGAGGSDINLLTSPIIGAFTSNRGLLADAESTWILVQSGTAIRGATTFDGTGELMPNGLGLEYFRVDRANGVAAYELPIKNSGTPLAESTASGIVASFLDAGNAPDYYAAPSITIEYRVNGGSWLPATDFVVNNLGSGISSSSTVDLRITNAGGTGVIIASRNYSGNINITDEPAFPLTLAAGASDTVTFDLTGDGPISYNLVAEGDTTYSDFDEDVAPMDGEFSFLANYSLSGSSSNNPVNVSTDGFGIGDVITMGARYGRRILRK